MRKKYFAEFRLSDAEVHSIWADAIFVFDANTVLNFYRYSEATRKDFLGVLEKIKHRIFLPDQAAQEFFNNRLGEISRQTKAYDDTKKTIGALRDELTKSRGHPFISDKSLEKLSRILVEVDSELNTNQEAHLSRINDDDILNSIASVFDGRVGEDYAEEKLSEIFEEGEKRFEAKTPPGFEDYPKHKAPISAYEKRANYGDLLVWKQTIDIANTKGKPVVLTTDDTKNDWWSNAHGRTVGPRPELIQEFYEKTGQRFLMYRPEQFLRYAKDHVHTAVRKETLEELREGEAERMLKERRELEQRFAKQSDEMRDWRPPIEDVYRYGRPKKVKRDIARFAGDPYRTRAPREPSGRGSEFSRLAIDIENKLASVKGDIEASLVELEEFEFGLYGGEGDLDRKNYVERLRERIASLRSVERDLMEKYQHVRARLDADNK